MLNKKLIAAAVAASCSTGVFANVDLNSPNSQLATYSLESAQNAGATSTIATYGTVAAITDAGAAVGDELTFETQAGVSIPVGTTVFVRFDLTNALFGANVPDTDLTVGSIVAADIVKRAGGLDGSSSVVFEVENNTAAAEAATAVVELLTAQYDVKINETASVQYRMFADLASAQNPTATNSIASSDAAFATVANVSTGDYAVGETATATIASQFTRFDNGLAVDSVGEIDTDRLIAAGTSPRNVDSSVATAADILDGSYTLTLAGDVSFGEAYLATGPGANPTCGNPNSSTTFNAAGQISGLTTAVLTGDDHKICLRAEDNAVITRGSYSLTLSQGTTELDDNIGSVVYNTTAYELPYLTTFDKYNQRLYITNNSSVDGAYTISFTGEEDATVTAKAAASGTVPANSMIVLRATDLVTIEGRTRTSAVVELEIDDSDAQVTVQSVNIATDGTDTVVLSAQ